MSFKTGILLYITVLIFIRLYGIKKIPYWSMYGVERFPYRSRRKHQSCLHQTFEGRIVIHNDIFGLTIKQFNREFEKCLLRRERNEQYMLNVRFPNKISSDYLEYLDNATIGKILLRQCIVNVIDTF